MLETSLRIIRGKLFPLAENLIKKGYDAKIKFPATLIATLEKNEEVLLEFFEGYHDTAAGRFLQQVKEIDLDALTSWVNKCEVKTSKRKRNSPPTLVVKPAHLNKSTKNGVSPNKPKSKKPRRSKMSEPKPTDSNETSTPEGSPMNVTTNSINASTEGSTSSQNNSQQNRDSTNTNSEARAREQTDSISFYIH